ncbi:hypothetical protein TRFO_06040 [Tritrichomonas foetus]|uniref:Ubiquitin-like domain-containing protein n=1 Tax=Tritrichomonas foetus TaxID=1144522 RepID=A0A1J4K6I1_9EUKA|nr:hypothetical protein TRFO_06040 [Tritrichomonas foetus]|eukprot:OHT05053.1 hypothetical protein TRFO_06040 [Tritrichomonas foetus]
MSGLRKNLLFKYPTIQCDFSKEYSIYIQFFQKSTYKLSSKNPRQTMESSQLNILIHYHNECYTLNVSKFDSISTLEDFIAKKNISQNINQNNTKIIFLFDEQQILPSFSFAFYGMNDNSEIYAIDQINSQNLQKNYSSRLSHKLSYQSKRENGYSTRNNAKMNSFSGYSRPLKFQTSRDLLNPSTRRRCFLEVFGCIPPPDVMQSIIDEITDPSVSTEAAKIRDRLYNRMEGTVRSHRMCLNCFTSRINKISKQASKKMRNGDDSFFNIKSGFLTNQSKAQFSNNMNEKCEDRESSGFESESEPESERNKEMPVDVLPVFWT